MAYKILSDLEAKLLNKAIKSLHGVNTRNDRANFPWTQNSDWDFFDHLFRQGVQFSISDIVRRITSRRNNAHVGTWALFDPIRSILFRLWLGEMAILGNAQLASITLKNYVGSTSYQQALIGFIDDRLDQIINRYNNHRTVSIVATPYLRINSGNTLRVFGIIFYGQAKSAHNASKAWLRYSPDYDPRHIMDMDHWTTDWTAVACIRTNWSTRKLIGGLQQMYPVGFNALRLLFFYHFQTSTLIDEQSLGERIFNSTSAFVMSSSESTSGTSATLSLDNAFQDRARQGGSFYRAVILNPENVRVLKKSSHYKSLSLYVKRHLEALPRPVDDKIKEAIKWFAMSMNITDGLQAHVNLVTSLEILLAFGAKEEGSISGKIALRGAILMSDDPEERQKIQQRLKKIYDIRSHIVHGGTPMAELYRQCDSGTMYKLERFIAEIIFAVIALVEKKQFESLDDLTQMIDRVTLRAVKE